LRKGCQAPNLAHGNLTTGGRTSIEGIHTYIMVENTTRAFGCPLRYIQGYGEFSNLASYTAKFGRACFIIDGFLFEELNARLKAVYKDDSGNFLPVCFKGECWDGEIERTAKIARGNGISVIVGVGGGKTLDTAKLCADELGLPVIIVPSSASNDAPVSEIAVLYTESGEYIGSRKMKRNAELVLVDSEIIAKSPRRLFVAGMGDALATWFEARANEASDSPNYVGQGYKRCKIGMAIAETCHETLFNDGKKALMALERGAITEAVENVIEANILMSGLGFQNTGLATAHGIHSGLTAVPSTHKYLHGEKVAFGIVCQMILENSPEEEIDEVMTFMVEIGLPVTLAQLDVEATHENISAIASKTVQNPLIHHEPFKITGELVYSAILAADQLGRRYLENN